MIKTILFLALIILLIPGVMAGEVAYGYIHINIVNNPPELQNIRVHDSLEQIDCVADLVDENPGTAKIIKKWYANNEPVEKSRIKYGDTVRCELVPVDDLGQEGASYFLEFRMPEPKLIIGSQIFKLF